MPKTLHFIQILNICQIPYRWLLCRMLIGILPKGEGWRAGLKSDWGNTGLEEWEPTGFPVGSSSWAPESQEREGRCAQLSLSTLWTTKYLSQKPMSNHIFGTHIESAALESGERWNGDRNVPRRTLSKARAPPWAVGPDPNSTTDSVGDPAPLFLNHTDPLLPDV